MKKIELEEIKRLQLDMLIYLDQICKENNIKYNIACGTLLGAVKYKKFIPWDDDIDVVLFRDEYMKLIEVLKDKDGKYKMFSIYNIKDYYYPFAKLIDTRTILNENAKKIKDYGVYIDIFPYDAYENDKDVETQAKSIKFIRNMMVRRYRIKECVREDFDYLAFYKRKVKFKKLKSFIYMSIDFLTLPLGYKFWVKLFDKKVSKIKIEDAIYVGDRAGEFEQKEYFKKEELLKQSLYEFEGLKFPSFENYDMYLKTCYGDYKKEPSEEQKKSHHIFTAYWKEDYNE